MTFCIITHVHHSQSEGSYFGYAPYVNEMNIWSKYADKIVIVAPLKNFDKSTIHQNYSHPNIQFIAVPDFSLLNAKAIIKTILNLPLLVLSIFNAMKKSHHIHLRCPGNMGLLGSCIQILFPKKKKTAKYAGNWDPNAKQPLSYKWQKRILKNTFLTRNMQVLVYGSWPNQTKNIRPFFTATYSEEEKTTVFPRRLDSKIRLLFVGSLASGKQPLYAVQLVERLQQNGLDVELSLYGEGTERHTLEQYCNANSLEQTIIMKGNQDKDSLVKAYKESHFLVLPSKSEGWPKVVAEAMFWGCLPVVTPISCVPFMVDNGNRGVLLTTDLGKDVAQLESLIKDQQAYNLKINSAMDWSRKYTTDVFESEIKTLMQP